MKGYALKFNDVEAMNRLCKGKTVDELKAMYDIVWDRYDEECKREDSLASMDFRIGDKAEWEGDGRVLMGIVKTVNARSLSLHQCSDGRPWRVGYRFIKKI